MDNVTENQKLHLRSVFTPGLLQSFKIVRSRYGYLALISFVNPHRSSVTVCEAFASLEAASRWVALGSAAADSVALSSGGPSNTATLSPAGEFPTFFGGSHDRI